MSEPTVWVIEPVAVYGHGPRAVFTSRQAAELFVATVRPDRDGHHGWRCTELRLDVPPEPEPPDSDDDKFWINQNRLTAAGDVRPTRNYRTDDEWIPLEEETT